jgi:hypothetical protein
MTALGVRRSAFLDSAGGALLVGAGFEVADGGIGGFGGFLPEARRVPEPVFSDFLLATDAGFFAAGALALGEGANPGLDGWQETVGHGLQTGFANLFPEAVPQGARVAGVFREFLWG